MDTTRGSLLLRVRDPRDSQAWEEFDAIYRPMIQQFARARGLGPADAEDVAQQCMTAIHAHIRSFEYDPAKGKFKAWLHTLVNNRIRNLLRDRHDRQATTRDLEEAQAREWSPEELFEQIWLREHLRYCLEQMRTEVQASTLEAFQRYVIEEQPMEQVCTALNMSPNQVHLIKWRVATKLRKRLTALLDGPRGSGGRNGN